MVAVTLVTHGESRYRQLLFPALIPYAAGLWATGWWTRAERRRHLLSVALALIMLMHLRYYPYDWASLHVRRAWAVALGDLAVARGNDAAAITYYEHAAQTDKYASDALLKLGQLYDRQGNLELAARTYRRSNNRNPPYIVANARLGDALRRLGEDDTARRAFAGSYSDQEAMVAWGWHNLRSSPPPTVIDIGNGLDIGFIDGMYAAERHGEHRARWTSEQATIRLVGGGDGTIVRVHVSAPRPDNHPVPAEICVARHCQGILVGALWRTYELLVPAICTSERKCGQEIALILRSETWVPASEQSDDHRDLGLLVDYVTSEPLPGDE